MFEEIRNDPYIIEIYNRIENPIFNKKFWTYHGLTHVENVIDIVEKTLIKLNYEEEYIENAKIAALMHDLGMVEGKENHEIKSYEIAKDYFERNNIKLKYYNEILESIMSHRDTTIKNNDMAAVLIFADKIDKKKTRLAPKGYEIEGLRQYQYIEDINILFDNNDFTVQFIIDNECDKKELEGWYFTPKVISAIKNFSDYYNFNLRILWNDDEWLLKENKQILIKTNKERINKNV